MISTIYTARARMLVMCTVVGSILHVPVGAVCPTWLDGMGKGQLVYGAAAVVAATGLACGAWGYVLGQRRKKVVGIDDAVTTLCSDEVERLFDTMPMSNLESLMSRFAAFQVRLWMTPLKRANKPDLLPYSSSMVALAGEMLMRGGDSMQEACTTLFFGGGHKSFQLPLLARLLKWSAMGIQALPEINQEELKIEQEDVQRIRDFFLPKTKGGACGGENGSSFERVSAQTMLSEVLPLLPGSAAPAVPAAPVLDSSDLGEETPQKKLQVALALQAFLRNAMANLAESITSNEMEISRLQDTFGDVSQPSSASSTSASATPPGLTQEQLAAHAKVLAETLRQRREQAEKDKKVAAAAQASPLKKDSPTLPVTAPDVLMSSGAGGGVPGGAPAKAMSSPTLSVTPSGGSTKSQPGGAPQASQKDKENA